MRGRHAKRLAAFEMVDGDTGDNGGRRFTLGAEKPVLSLSKGGYDARDFIAELRERSVTPHVAQNLSGRRSAIDRRMTRHPGYAVSMRIRKRIVEVFAWVKSPAPQGKTRFRGLANVRFTFTHAVAAYNLALLPKLLERG